MDGQEEAGEVEVDVLVVGAGLSGIGTAWHLRNRCPGRSFLLLESRAALGGTWDLFRYPGIRSDSDMYTLGFGFEPWTGAQAIADGSSILAYLNQVVDRHDLRRFIRFGHRVVAASFDSKRARWSVEVETGRGRQMLTARWLHLGTGYYDYEEAHLPRFAGSEEFAGPFFHAQFFPPDLDYRGKEVVVIGSGATAVTLVPAMAGEASRVTMLQRSPTYMVSRPSADRWARRLRRLLGNRLGTSVVRWRNVLMQMAFFQLSRRRPAYVRRLIARGLERQLPPHVDRSLHFSPRYDPWDQRLCLVPDADLFAALRSGRADIVTDEVERFTRDGILLRSGRTLRADIIVAATGLKLRLLGGIRLEVDGSERRPGGAMTYKGMMFAGLPNLSYSFGYTNASWTLKADLTASYLCRLLNHMERSGMNLAVPEPDPSVKPLPFIDFSSGYVLRARDLLPVQGERGPWRLHQNYLRDLASLKLRGVEDGVMRFARAGEPGMAPAA
jgi:monooxygenase